MIEFTSLPAAMLNGAPPEGLILAMMVSYLLGFSGMLLAYLNYRKRHGAGETKRDAPASEEKHKP
jgi:hypothetical protein